MDPDDLHIEQSLSFSEQQDGLIRGHQQEMQQVLADKQHLRDIIAHQQKVIGQKNETIEQLTQDNQRKDNRIAELEAHIARIEARPQYDVDTYVETQNIEKQILQYRPKSIAKSKRKSIDLTNQPTLWPMTTALSL